MNVSRETVEKVVRRFGVPDLAETAEAVVRLLAALAAEPDPPTTIRDPLAALDAHVADSLSGLAVAQLRSARRVVDLGAGAGFPGLALAAALPDARVDLLESGARKCDVIRRLAAAACLEERVKAIAVRAEDHGRGAGRGAYEIATARALGALPVLCEYAAPLLRVDGALVAWKGTRVHEEERAAECAAAELGLSPAEVLPVRPFSGSRERHLYVYRKLTETPARYPRRAGQAAKRPLG